jgi:hypothetical protein
MWGEDRLSRNIKSPGYHLNQARLLTLRRRFVARYLYLFFFQITQYIVDAHNARTLIHMNTRTQTLPLEATSKTVPANPQD